MEWAERYEGKTPGTKHPTPTKLQPTCFTGPKQARHFHRYLEFGNYLVFGVRGLVFLIDAPRDFRKNISASHLRRDDRSRRIPRSALHSVQLLMRRCAHRA